MVIFHSYVSLPESYPPKRCSKINAFEYTLFLQCLDLVLVSNLPFSNLPALMTTTTATTTPWWWWWLLFYYYYYFYYYYWWSLLWLNEMNSFVGWNYEATAHRMADGCIVGAAASERDPFGCWCIWHLDAHTYTHTERFSMKYENGIVYLQSIQYIYIYNVHM